MTRTCVGQRPDVYRRVLVCCCLGGRPSSTHASMSCDSCPKEGSCWVVGLVAQLFSLESPAKATCLVIGPDAQLLSYVSFNPVIAARGNANGWHYSCLDFVPRRRDRNAVVVLNGSSISQWHFKADNVFG